MTNPKIKHGFLNIFDTFQIFQHKNSNKDLEKYILFLERFRQSGLMISAESPNKKVYFTNRFEEYLAERKELFRKSKNTYNGDLFQIKDSPQAIISVSQEAIVTQLDSDIEDELEITQYEYLNQLVALYQLEELHTGLPSKDYKNRFMLFPSKVTLANGQEVYMGIYLTIYKHGYAILHLTLEIKNMEFEELNKIGWNISVEKAMMPELLINGIGYKLKKKSRVRNIQDVLAVYRDYIMDILPEHRTNFSIGSFYNLSLSEYAFQPETFEKNSTEKFNETFFKILYAPISEFTMQSDEDIKNLMSDLYFSFSKNIRVYANSNRTISAYAKELKKHRQFKDLNDHELNRMLQHTSLGGIVTAVEILLLKKITQEKYMVFNLNSNTSLKRMIDLYILEDTNYMHEFSQYFFSYGTVRELIKFFNIKCEDFLQAELIEERKRRLEKLIKLKKERNVATFSILGPILSIALTLVLSLPTIKEILKAIKKENILLETYITINTVFIIVVLWLFRNQISESYYTFKNVYFPSIRRFFYNLHAKSFWLTFHFSEFMNRDIKTFFR